MGRSTYIGIAAAFAFSSFAFRFFFKPHQHHQPSRLFTVQELSLYNGTDEQLPIFLGILGDASRAFVSGNFTGDGLTDTLRGLSSSEVKSVVEWRDFFLKTYTFVGRLVGRYYDFRGMPTKYLKNAEAKAARGAQLLEKQKREEEKIPNCNSKWSQHEGGEVWCDDGYPRLMQRPLEIALTGKMSKRCVCLKEDELQQSGLEVYEGCDYHAKACKV
ncbi:membrane-associated progesterone-binding protein 4-like isoform X2 [Chenopodium quinoa]|uniref:membrane-associated progesterone-binding protein 4-like isoform X2 n=1 Tax=Chenopodium quinoa TaxID=63459 RepID=UPI000B778680|nr:membrane-associated progesterone-binding protein 4-like isoform X2 [Chenopodium quinoa]